MGRSGWFPLSGPAHTRTCDSAAARVAGGMLAHRRARSSTTAASVSPDAAARLADICAFTTGTESASPRSPPPPPCTPTNLLRVAGVVRRATRPGAAGRNAQSQEGRGCRGGRHGQPAQRARQLVLSPWGRGGGAYEGQLGQQPHPSDQRRAAQLVQGDGRVQVLVCARASGGCHDAAGMRGGARGVVPSSASDASSAGRPSMPSQAATQSPRLHTQCMSSGHVVRLNCAPRRGRAKHGRYG
jgi:hypothetical protein